MPISSVNIDHVQAAADIVNNNNLFTDNFVILGKSYKVFEIVGMTTYAFLSFVFVVLSFVFGIFERLKEASFSREDIGSFVHISKILIFPFLYMFIGIVIHSILFMIIKFFYEINPDIFLVNFFGLKIEDIQLQTHVRHQDFAKMVIETSIWLKNSILITTVLVYYSLIFFFLGQMILVLQPQFVRLSVFGSLFSSVILLIFGTIVVSTFDNISSYVLFKEPTFINDEIGTVSSIHELSSRNLRYFARRGLQMTD